MEKYLRKALGEERGGRLYARSEERLARLRCEAEPQSMARNMILKGMLLPYVALFQILEEEGMEREEILSLLDGMMVETAGLPLKKKYDRMDSLPWAYALFRLGFTKVVSHFDLWSAELDTSDKDRFRVGIHQCFWYDTFCRYGCPEVCSFACKCDELTFGNMKHIDFRRTQTLGTGGCCCDFEFTKKRPG